MTSNEPLKVGQNSQNWLVKVAFKGSPLVVKHARNLFVWIVVERNKFNLNTKNVF